MHALASSVQVLTVRILTDKVYVLITCYTLSDKIWSGKNMDGQNMDGQKYGRTKIWTDKKMDTFAIFVHILSVQISSDKII